MKLTTRIPFLLRTLWLLGLLVFSSLAFATPTFAQQSRITPEIFLSLPIEDQREVVMMLMKTVVEMEAAQLERGIKYKNKYTWNEERIENIKKMVQLMNSLILESAHAFTGDKSEIRKTCLYGGWYSNIVKQGNEYLCTHPSKSVDFAKEYNKSTGACSGTQQITCNPDIFGSPTLCVPGNSDAANTSAICYQEVLKRPDMNKRLDDLVEKFKKNNCAKLKELLDLIYRICACGDKKLPNKNFSKGYAKYMAGHRTCLGLLGQTRLILRKIQEKPGQLSCFDKDQSNSLLTNLEEYFKDFDEHLFKKMSRYDFKNNVGKNASALDTWQKGHSKPLVAYFGETCNDDGAGLTTTTTPTGPTGPGDSGSDGDGNGAGDNKSKCNIEMTPVKKDDGTGFSISAIIKLKDGKEQDLSLDGYTVKWSSEDPAIKDAISKITAGEFKFDNTLEKDVSMSAVVTKGKEVIDCPATAAVKPTDGEADNPECVIEVDTEDLVKGTDGQYKINASVKFPVINGKELSSSEYDICWWNGDKALEPATAGDRAPTEMSLSSTLESPLTLKIDLDPRVEDGVKKSYKCELQVDNPEDGDGDDPNAGDKFAVDVIDEGDDDYDLEGKVTPTDHQPDYTIKWKHGDNTPAPKKEDKPKDETKGKGATASDDDEEPAPADKPADKDEKKKEDEPKKEDKGTDYKATGATYSAPRGDKDYEACADFIKDGIIAHTECETIPKKEAAAPAPAGGNGQPGFQPMALPEYELYNQGLN